MNKLADLLPGTLDLLVLKAVSLGPLHGYGILLRIQQITKQILQIEQGSLYPALYRLERAGLIGSEWGVSDNNRARQILPTDNIRTIETVQRGGAMGFVLQGRWPCLGRITGGGVMRIDQEMDDEMRFHIESYRRDLEASGVPAEEAARRARVAFGNLTLTKEAGREAKGLRMFDEFVRNVAYALRQLRRSPGFAAAVILTLALCIGVNTAVYSVIDAALLRPLPYPEPDRLFEVVREMRRGTEIRSMNGQDGYAWEALKNARSVQIAAGGGTSGVNLSVGNRAVYVQQQRVGAGYFGVLGIPLAQGREFNEDEDRNGGSPAVVLSHGIWLRLFNGDSSIVGRVILLRGEPHLVTGIAGAQFRPQRKVDVWTPLKPSTKGEGAGINYALIARLHSGVTLAQAKAEVETLGAAAFERREIPAEITAHMGILPFDRANQASLRDRMLILVSAVAMVLLIGCVNIASLMLARGAVRRREMGTRIALGGGPASLIRQLTTESVVLGLIGGVAGLVLGYIAIGSLQKLIARYGIWQELRIDGRVLLATAVLSLLVGVLFGLAPAVQAARVDVRETLLEGGSRSVVGGRSHWLRRSLVVAEVALSLLLMVGAGLLIRTMFHLQNLDPGFDGSNVLTASASLQDARYGESASVNRLFRESLAAIRMVPGVEAAAVGLHVPYQRWLNSGVKVRGGTSNLASETGTSVNYVTPGYFEALRILVRAGRVFDERDAENAAPVALVNDTFVRLFLKGENTLTCNIVEGSEMRQIIGVVSDLQQQPGLSSSGPITHEPAMYVPAAQFGSGGFRMAHTWYSPSWVVRSSGKREEIARSIEHAIAAVDPLLPVASFSSMIDERDSALKSQRMNAWLLGSLAALAVALELVGVYGIVANSVVERTREFGIRMALGGSRGRILWIAVAPGIAMAALGAGVGALTSAACVKVLKGLLYGVQPIDGQTFTVMGAALIGVSVTASLLAAVGVLRLTPGDVLRQG